MLHLDALLLADSDTKGCTNAISIRYCRSKRKMASDFRQKIKPIIRHYQNSVLSLSTLTADARIFRIVKEVYQGRHKHCSLT